MYGAKYISSYKNELVAMFEAGQENKSVKLSADQMCNKLKQRHPNVMALPSTHKIKIIINRLATRHKQGKKGLQDGSKGGAIPDVITEALVKFLNTHGDKAYPRGALTLSNNNLQAMKQSNCLLIPR